MQEDLEIQARIKENFDRRVSEIKNYVETCVRESSLEGIEIIGKNGGYIDIPEAINYQNTSYWFLDSSNIQPTIEEIEIRLENYISHNVKECVNLDRFRNQSFVINEESVLADIDFFTETVSLNVNYPIEIIRGDLRSEFRSFTETYDIRFRRIFELASQIINKHLEQKFDVYWPMILVNTGNFDVEYSEFDDNEKKIKFTITDNTRRESGNNYVFNFASRYNLTKLTRTVELRENSNLYPTLFDELVYSTDRFFELYIRNGSKISYEGYEVEEITVSQSYPNKVIMKNLIQDNNGILKDINITTKWPVYDVMPIKGEIDKKQELRIYWDEENNPRTGDVGILYMNESNWQPLNSIPVYEEDYVYAYIDEFTNYTAVDCGIQENQKRRAKEKLNPNWACFLDIASYVFGGFVLDIASVDYEFPSNWIRSDTGDECVTFTPTCDQQIIVTKTEEDGIGECTLPSGKYEGGKEYTLCARVQSCNTQASNLCRSCSVKCELIMK